jgi:hypothetical protein
MFKNGQKYQALYMNIYVCSIVSCKVESTYKRFFRMKLYQAFRVAEGVQILNKRATKLH